jgi:hypothetical protein
MANNEATRQNIAKQRRGPDGKLLPKIVDTPLKPVVDALNSTLKAIREHNAEVPNVVLVVGASGRKSRTTLALGHFSPKSWESKGAQHEIAISGEVLRQGAEGVLETMLHEAAHALAEAREIKDTSRQGRFHNKRFKAVAEEVGLTIPESDKSIGWSNTRLTKETKALYKAQLAELTKALKLYRLPAPPKPDKPKSTTKVECGCRSITLSNTFLDKGAIRCEECGEVFLAVGSDSDDDE